MVQSKVNSETSPFLHAWDTTCRKYSQFFQVHAIAARDDLQKLNSSPLTNWKDVTQRQDRYQAIDSLDLRR